ncbi:50S ribosomal protein L34e [Candidatus Woesearchaeota archaeon]|nr:50S ribosomal protein L34e [Candidatus Woesearchaeota archaeon]
MPSPRRRSRHQRKITRRTPGGIPMIRYGKRKPGKARCGDCGKELSGVARELPYVMRNLPKSAKNVARPYGGNLCFECSREVIKEKARLEVKL